MKIRVTEYTTEIEATSSEIAASQTLAGQAASLLSRCFTPCRAYDEEEETEDHED